MDLLSGLVLGAIVLALVQWLRSRDIAVKWYEWLIGAGALVLLVFSIQNFFGSRAETEFGIANLYLLVMSLPAIVLGAVATLLVWRRQRASA